MNLNISLVELLCSCLFLFVVEYLIVERLSEKPDEFDLDLLRMNDSGNIKCVATNILGRATTVANLTIEASPRLELPENYNDGLIFRYDEVIRMKIPLIAKPPPRITWFFDDEPISASEDVQIEITDTLTSLRIGAAKRWHCGEFR